MTVSDHAPIARTAAPAVDGGDPTALSKPAGLSAEAAGIVDVVLEGGPANLPADLRSHRVSPAEHKIKVCHHGGYEHFERDGSGLAGGAPLVFRWTGRTRIAE